MNSYTFMGLDDVEEGEEISSRMKSFIKRAIAYIKIRRQASQVTRNSITIDRAGAHERLVAAFFPMTRSVVSQDLWIWHAFFGAAGSNNNINVLYQSPLFNDLKTNRAPEIPFVTNGVSYPSGYYLVDGIYPKLATREDDSRTS
nr:hypothetical protein [Tanacetum cinerariifolium]